MCWGKWRQALANDPAEVNESLRLSYAQLTGRGLKTDCSKIRCGMKETKKKTPKTVFSNTAQAISRRIKRILVADDDKIVQSVVTEALELMGFEVATAGNGLEALSVFLESSFDLVLTDLQMPVMDGLRLASRIKSRSPNTPVILLTGVDRETVGGKMVRAFVDSVIFKPFRLEELEETVQLALVSG